LILLLSDVTTTEAWCFANRCRVHGGDETMVVFIGKMNKHDDQPIFFDDILRLKIPNRKTCGKVRGGVPSTHYPHQIPGRVVHRGKKTPSNKNCCYPLDYYVIIYFNHRGF
jgi:hypothetical protein